MLREDPFYSLFHISSSSYHARKKDWNSLFGKQFELFVGILLERFVPDPVPESFKLPRNRQLCDYPVVFGEEKFALEIKNRYGSADRRIREGYLEIYDKIKAIDNGTWQPVFLIRATDNVPAAINQWKMKGWQVYQGEEMNDFLIKYTGFDLNKFLNKITLPRIRQTPSTEAELNDYLSR